VDAYTDPHPEGGSADFLSAEEAVIYNGQQFYVTRDAAQTWTIVPPDVKFDDVFAAWIFQVPPRDGSSRWIRRISASCIEAAMEAGHGFPSLHNLDADRVSGPCSLSEFRSCPADD
jgi:hypothetical protein